MKKEELSYKNIATRYPAFYPYRKQIEFKNLFFFRPATFFENDSILRSINFPVNYIDRDVTKYLSPKYIVEESMLRVKKDIGKMSAMMKQYDFEKEDVESIILNKLKRNENIALL